MMGVGLLMFLLVDSLFLRKQLNQHLFFGYFVPNLTNVISNFRVICMLINKNPYNQIKKKRKSYLNGEERKLTRERKNSRESSREGREKLSKKEGRTR